MTTLQRLPWDKEWPYAGMLMLSLALGIAVAAGVDAWSESEEITASGLLADAAAALVIVVVMAVFGWLTHQRLFEKTAARGTHDPLS
jgi:hypothetical protein